MATNDSKPEERPDSTDRSWSTWRLLSLSAVVLAVGGVLASAVKINRQRVAIHEIEQFSGSVSFLDLGPQWLCNWVGEKQLKWIQQPNHVVFRADAETLSRRSRSGGLVTGWAPLIDDQSLKCVLGLPRLKSLDLAFSNTGDSGLKHVCQLRHLEFLRLEGTDVSNISIPVLSQLRSLKELNVRNTKITTSGARRLAMNLPGCDVQGAHNDKWANW